MSLPIIIDKSTFQSLNFSELYRLSCYYFHNITPVLVMEILGDLKKNNSTSHSSSEDRVKDMAKKLFPSETTINIHYKYILRGELLGDKINMDGRPTVDIKKTAISSKGEKGFVINESEEERSIYKWKNGNFTEADKELSSLWRMTTTEENVLQRLKKELNKYNKQPLSSFKELGKFVDSCINIDDSQFRLLLALVENYEIDAGTSLQILERWFSLKKPLLKDFAPYAFHCLKVDMLFLFGLSSGLIGTRSTNRVDLEYLYYLPFCNIFTSNDKFHIDLVPLLLTPYQKFIIGTKLKNDLKTIDAHIENLSLKEQQNHKSDPPILENSITFQLWKYYFNYPENSNSNKTLSKEEFDVIKPRLDRYLDVMESDGNETELESSDDAEFIVKHSYLNKDDLCYCGSKKRIIDCCMTEEQFDKIAQKTNRKN